MRAGDVTEAGEKARQRRIRGVAVVLAVIGLPFVVRTGIGVIQWLMGHDGSAASAFGFSFVPHLPAGTAKYLPAMALISVLLVAMIVPMLGAGRSPHVLYRPEELDTTLDDVVGAGVVVEEVVKTLNLFLAHKTFRNHMGGTPRRAILFEGPPGTGKTYLAKAMAAEAGVPFLFVSSSAFQSMYYGATNRKIRSYFKALRKYARQEGGAIGFIEEIDAIGASRGGMSGTGQREGVAGVVNELLIQLQSFDQPPAGVKLRAAAIDAVNRFLPVRRRIRKPRIDTANILVIGATNRAADLDAALVRPGRFDRTITVDLPSRAGRREIIDYYLDRKAHDVEMDLPVRRETLAGSTFGYSPVMLEHLLDEALIWALRRGAEQLNWEDIQRAKMTEELGLAQPVEYAEKERRVIATHESGHATVAHLVAAEHRKLEVLSIIKRKAALGLLAHSETEERWTRSRSEIEALIKIAMGGMVAEELFFGETSSGVSGDLKAATEAAAQMVGSFGMAGTLVSLEAAGGPSGANLVAKVLSDDAGRAAVEHILETSRDEVRHLLSGHRFLVEALRDALLERDELIGDEITTVLAEARSERATVPDYADSPA